MLKLLKNYLQSHPALPKPMTPVITNRDNKHVKALIAMAQRKLASSESFSWLNVESCFNGFYKPAVTQSSILIGSKYSKAGSNR